MAKFVRLQEGAPGFCEKLKQDGKRTAFYYVYKWQGSKVNLRLCSANVSKARALKKYEKARAIHKAVMV